MKQLSTILARLNESQKRAVESIHGSFMVVAGPGTGKTQVLSARTAYILENTDVQPGNILISTFTEAGVIAIKKRLFDFIGAASYKVEITTLHGFANSVISQYPDYFVKYRAFAQMDELESYEMVSDILESGNFPELRPVNGPDLYLRDIVSALKKLREESVFPEDFPTYIDEQEEIFMELLGEINPKLKKFESTKKSQESKIAKYRELHQIYIQYEERKKLLGKYDFADMILHVVRELESNDLLAADLAERYQYIMIDEFQDLSNGQNRLVEGLLRMSDSPNIMTVGDDDQSIYRFQGANLENMLHFSTKYPSTEIIVLSTNYRSGQEILDASSALIQNNSTRLASLVKNLDKPLISGLERNSIVKLESYTSTESERTAIIQTIQKLLDDGVPPREIAIITRINSQVALWSGLLESNNIPIESRAKGNLFESEEYRLLSMILRIVSSHTIDSTDCIEFIRIGIAINDSLGLYRLLRNFGEFKRKTMTKPEFFEILNSDEFLLDAVGEAQIDKWKGVRQTILKLRSVECTYPIGAIQEIEEILGLRAFIEKRNGLKGLSRLYALYDFISTGYGSNRFSDIAGIVRYWKRMQQFGITFPQIEFATEPGVQILTAHQSKGLEYDVVFIPESIDGNWGSRRSSEKFSLPTTITGKKIEKDDQDEEERRLFFVAMTRAKKELLLSFPESISNKAVVQSQFLSETRISGVQNPLIAQPELLLITRTESIFLMSLQEQERDFLEKILSEYRIGPTDLAKFLDSPEVFLRNVLLRYPFEDTPSTLFGTCYHAALEQFYIQWKSSKIQPSATFLIEQFERRIRIQPLTLEQKEDALERGKKGLAGWYELLGDNSPLPVAIEYDATVRKIVFDGIPLKGKIDRIDEISPGSLHIIDYKTGRVKSENELRGETKNSDGAYYKQLLFYKLLTELDDAWGGAKAESLSVWFVEGRDGKYPQYSFHPTSEEMELFKAELRDAWSKISNVQWWLENLGR